ncbi:ankyrin repeat-containing domain protein, partial [Stachybotrys elegans]
KAQLNTRDRLGRTPLHKAVEYGRMEAVEILTNGGADPDIPDLVGQTPLICSISEHGVDGEEIALHLIRQGADIHAKDAKGFTACYRAAQRGCLSVLGELISKGADVNIRPFNGKTPLMEVVHAAGWHHLHNRYAIYEAAAGLLLSGGADPDIADNKKKTPLAKAAKDSEDGLCQLLLHAGANVAIVDYLGRDALMRAASSIFSTRKTLDLLIAHGADVNAASPDGMTPLMMAAETGGKKAMERLIYHGAHVNSINKDGKTALDFA